jgi:hypothetical protein
VHLFSAVLNVSQTAFIPHTLYHSIMFGYLSHSGRQ